MIDRPTPRVGGRLQQAIAPALRRAAMLACIAVLAACETTHSPSATPPKPAPEIVSLDEWMSRGDAAAKADNHIKAREAWRAAARDYPVAKQPWLKLAEDYFNASDYGNAVLAAQEVLQRDPHDRVANSVLAVSGLRLTAGSLTALREEGSYAVGSRDEAVAVTHALRDALGEPVLVPSAGRPRPPRPHSRTAAEAAPAPPPVPTPAPAPPPRAAAATPAPPPAGGGNPLDKLR